MLFAATPCYGRAMNRRTASIRPLLLVAMLVACGGDDADDPATDAASAPELDASAADAGPDAASPDAAPQACPPTFAGCGTPLDLTGMSSVTIGFNREYYTPACIRVSAGTTVSIAATDRHPLAAAPCSEEDFIGAPAGGTT